MGRKDKKKKRFNKGNDGTNKFEKIILGVISIFLTFTVFSIISGFIALMEVGSQSMPKASNPSGNKPVNILLLGMDIGDPNQEDNKDIKRTDTIMVVNYNPETDKITTVSVPRDTLIQNNGNSVKINSAFAIGGYSRIKTEVEGLLNVNINYIVKVDYDAFVDIIDAIGGVKMKIERNMIYDDEGQNLHINFKAGETVKLDGQKAQEFFRWRKNNDGSGFANGDLDRIQNQQKFIAKVIDKCTNPLIVFRIPKIMSAIGNNVETNMSPFSIIKYGLKFMGVSNNDISMLTAAGTPKTINGQSFLVFDKNSNKDIISQLASSEVSSKSENGISKENIKIKILNATKINGLASELKINMNNIGYTKIDTGNTELSDKTVILSNNKNMLKTISKDLDIKNSGKKDDKAEYKDYDVIIILGKDFKKFGE
ncbi:MULTISPECIES: LCP family protein [Clostridium]|uniref:LytR family transcriptional regulator n=1 Tax=Clostridium butyricum TaxID=1492 RepID=A0AAP9UGE1_CLOBU|nr:MULTISPECIES: LCP family protein [Clostridium]AXB86062.1 LytR family transcriptional regulator [Clostridium butyricum]KIU09233.1 membrane-bound protein LytR [Clostridium butyricum]KQB77674.1 transcriptional regulator [Clostridium butyricum]MBA8965559.1 LCP family protein required for cell wall assembly [Clostridium butyricum]MBA8969884.1 LCP family protein required for cell wall assembly [Clostridium butyricum]